MPAQSSEPLAEVVGRNCRRIRTTIGVTQDELARHARNVGLRWTASGVGDFEAGRSAPTFATVLAVMLALQMAFESRQGGGKSPVTLREMVKVRGGSIGLNDGADVWGHELFAACSGGTVDPGRIHLTPTKEKPADVSSIAARSGVTEYRLAKQIGTSRERLAAVSFRLWHSTFSEERDRRAGPDSNQQKRGRISREMRAELEKAIADGHDQ